SDGFSCGLDNSGDDGAYGDPCEFLDVCNPGSFCANMDAVPDCAGDIGCCSEFCDLGSDDPDAMCTGAAQGQACVPWYDRDQAPPGLANVGACLIP
ncbi:MAG: hypothetical protein IAG13_28785, partial [Deltaproteobacteria bacterium]|nr:hypothetical protein [Nannocystaceae bacterium]